MEIRNQFEVPLPPAEAWALLMNVPVTAACFPGAELTETIDESRYKGRVTVKLGPVAMVFAGHLRVEDRDDARRSATVKATWTETKGRGNAVTATRFAMTPQGGGTLVALASDIQLAGQVAQYGRGVGMISALSVELISKFSDNVRARIQATPGVAHDAARKDAAPAQHGISVFGLIWQALVRRFKRIVS